MNKSEGPPLFRLTQRIAETPPLFLEELELAPLVSDLLMDAGGKFLSGGAAKSLGKKNLKKQYRQLLQIITYLLHDQWFLERKNLSAPMLLLLQNQKLSELSEMVKAEDFITENERREELARLTLDGLGLFPEGENEVTAADRLTTLDSVERARLIEKTRIAQQRARELREEMARREAEEAASKMTRE